MPKAWSAKDERKYEHIKAGEKRLGRTTRHAKEIAARTVNRDRRLEGRTPRKTTSGTGNPTRSLRDHSVRELRNRARQLRIRGRSRMRKSQLVASIRRAE
jgi:hypothetical protein